MVTPNNHNGKGIMTVLLIILLIINSIGITFMAVSLNNLAGDIAKSNSDTKIALNGLSAQIGQVNTAIAMQTQQLTSNLNNITNQVQGQNTKIDALTNTVTKLQPSLDSANNQIAALQKQETSNQATNQATIATLQTTITDLKTKLQQTYTYPYSYPYPYQPNAYPYSYPYPYNPLIATIQSSSNVLTLSAININGGLGFTTRYTLTGYVKIMVTNPTPYDITDRTVVVNFQLSSIPSIGPSSIQLSGGGIAWVTTTANANQLSFQSAQYGVDISAGQSLTWPLTLTISQSQPSAIASCPWGQGYPFQASVCVN